MNANSTKILALVGLVLYVVSPIDLVPGPIDDVILMLMYAVMSHKRVGTPDLT